MSYKNKSNNVTNVTKNISNKIILFSNIYFTKSNKCYFETR